MFDIVRGTSRTFTVTVRDGAGALVDLGAARIYFTVRDSGTDAVLIAKANAAGGGGDAQIEVTGPGVFDIKITNADTAREPLVAVCDGFVVTTLEHLQPVPNQPFRITQATTRTFPTP